MLDELYLKHRAELFNYCRMICGNASDAEDLVQETFLKALSSLDTLCELDTSKIRAWLYKVARNCFYDRCRRKKLEQKYFEPKVIETDGGFSAVNAAQLLALLPPELAAAFKMRYFQGYSSSEIAEFYSLSPSGVRAMLSRARKILKKELSKGD